MTSRCGVALRSLVAGLVLVLVVGCGTLDAGSAVEPLAVRPPSDVSASPLGSRGSAQADPEDRLTLLRTCPSRAPSWSDEEPLPDGLAGEVEQRRRNGMPGDLEYVRAFYREYERDLAANPSVAVDEGRWSLSYGFLMTVAEERDLVRIHNQVQKAVPVAARYLRELPASQAGSLRVDAVHDTVVVQVTRDEKRVREELQELVGDEAQIVVEVVRYPNAELKQGQADLAERMQDLGAVSISAGNGNSRVEVSVLGDADEPRRRIEEFVDPCMVLVTSAGPGPHLAGPSGVRGVRAAVECAEDGTPGSPVVQGGPTAVEGEVEQFVLCRTGDRLVIRSDSPTFAALAEQLSRQSTASGGMLCSLVAYSRPLIYAVAASGSWLIDIPTGACGRPYDEIYDLLPD